MAPSACSFCVFSCGEDCGKVCHYLCGVSLTKWRFQIVCVKYASGIARV